MDQSSRSPEGRERGVSSEPCSTRPNPFDEDDVSSRKRRRTSMSGSRSRSVDSITSAQGMSSSTTIDYHHNPAPDSTMKVDTDPATPKTPELQSATAELPTEPPSSRVTINLRNAVQAEGDSPPSSPVSPTPHATALQLADHDVKTSVEDSEVDMAPPLVQIVDTPQSSASGTASPEVEIIALPDDDDIGFGNGAPEVNIIGEDIMPLDPTLDFPYHDAQSGETLPETVLRVINYLSNSQTLEDGVFDLLRNWMDNYFRYAQSVGYDTTYDSYRTYQSFWHTFPELIWTLACRKNQYAKNSHARHILMDFSMSFARLTAYYVVFDCQTLFKIQSMSFNDRRGPELLSPVLLTQLHNLTRREETRILDTELAWARADEIAEVMEHFQSMAGGNLNTLLKLVQTQINLVPRYPRLTENLASACQVVADILRESIRKLQGPVLPQFVDQAKHRVSLGFQFYNVVAGALSTFIEKYVTHLTNDGVSSQIIALTEIYRHSLQADNRAAVDTLSLHRQAHPELPHRYSAEAIAWEWRFGMLGRLITSSQMQLRVMAVTTMCTDLVAFWKKFNDNEEDANPYLVYFAEYLLRTKLVEYILGPTCHPEITIEAGNIVGFLLVTKFYRNEQSDLLWHTIRTTQDPRISEALIRMTTHIANLYSKDGLLYLCEKLQSLPVDEFTPQVRNLCDAVFKQLLIKFQYDRETPSFLPYSLCIRLLRESSVCGPQSQIAHPNTQQFAMQKFKELLVQGPDPEGRRNLYLNCIEDIAEKSPTTLGSLWCLYMAVRPALASEIHVLATEHDLTRLLVDELEHAIEAGRVAGVPAVMYGPTNSPRKELIVNILLHEPRTITTDLGFRLWDMLVGSGAACQEDRKAGWQVMNNVAKRAGFDNPFLATCFTEYFPNLPPDCFCDGALDFVRDAILPRVNDINDIILDDTDSVTQSGIEQLWRIILTAFDPSIIDSAIQTLVCDIYVESKSILSYPHHRARQVHLGLVNRCLEQLDVAAKKLNAFNDGTNSGDDEPMVIVATDDQVHEQEHIFIRSLAVLRHFLQAHQAKAHFAAPDLRSLMQQSASSIEGDSAELKYQSFDGDMQTDVKPLDIGRQNTAASLLASLREVTGFENYRIYYRGHAFLPSESEICKSLEDLRIHNGLILVKREADGTTPSTRIKPGASPLEIEILSHFKQFWGYLSMEEKLAQEIYQFLLKLPADDQILEAFETPSTSHQQIFPLGQPFKCLYAVHALREYLESARRLKDTEFAKPDTDRSGAKAFSDALKTARALLVAAISDSEILNRCPSEHIQSFLAMCLITHYVRILEDTENMSGEALESDFQPPPLERLISILSTAANMNRTETTVQVILATFSAILRSCSMSPEFWATFKQNPRVGQLIESLILDDPIPGVRSHVAKLIDERLSSVASPDYIEFFWPLISGLIAKATKCPSRSHDVLQLSHSLLVKLASIHSRAVDLPMLAEECSDLLLQHTTSEEIGQLESEDVVASGLIKILHCCLCLDVQLPVSGVLADGLARQLFWHHLFPPARQQRGEPVPRSLLSSKTRERLCEVVFALVKDRDRQFGSLLQDLSSLVPFDRDEDGSYPRKLLLQDSNSHSDEEDPYLYELTQQFERQKAVRSSCGYVGLRNLSNTCYLNSLFTQLFMNTGFRGFVMNASIRDAHSSQKLLSETQKLFGHMQESYRKYIDPALLVSSIKTYDDTVIDVHNQMDVDEFYNLLFDRWEGQLLTVEERKTLRSFYGGQLVQQVSSKECEHISERLEPFSAIQCDIKGKSTLQDSLQAYVDGEIMEGENKYKCSTCDRHVDAVKRACLKDIPDSLIFHLKRFDFNLRTLQRSKINDYFSFPARIDMRPYTIEHIGEPSQPGEEDSFELVGVLVHSGTAESGHYYSYIRERPSTGSSEAWIEFNDDMVSAWDPAQLESSTFGGPDFRPPFDSGVVYDKTYSAYMLFYQRSSSLRSAQEKMQMLSLPTPLQVTLPLDLSEHIRNDNTVLLRRHCLYDPSHVDFVLKVFRHARQFNGGQCSSDHAMESLAMHMLLGHLDQVVSRTKDLPDFEIFRKILGYACGSCAKCSFSFYQYYHERHESFRVIVQRNADHHVRDAVGTLFVDALQNIKEKLPHLYGLSGAPEDELPDSDWGPIGEPVIKGTVQILNSLWANFHVNLRSWPEYFWVVLSFAQMGPMETALLLSEDYLYNVLRIVGADTNTDLPSNYVRMLTNVVRRMATRPPSYEMIINLIDHFMDALVDHIEYKFFIEQPEQRLQIFRRHGGELPWTSNEASVFYSDWGSCTGSTFVKKLIEIDQEPIATESILQRLIQASKHLDSRVFYALKTTITGHMVQQSMVPHLRAAIIYTHHSDNILLVHKLLEHVSLQCRNLQHQDGKAFLDFLKDNFPDLEANPGNTTSLTYYHNLRHLPIWASGLLGYYDPSVRRETEEFLGNRLFQYCPDHEFAENEGGFDRSVAIQSAARRLAMNCLVDLRENFIKRRTQVAKQSIENLQSVISSCEAYFDFDINVNINTEVTEALVPVADFRELSSAILEPLRRITVEELEEEGSDWENSCASSEQLESLADVSMQAAGDLPDSDLA